MNTRHEPSDEVLQCIDDCQQCHDTCLQMATQHCLAMGGAHAAPDHIALMLTCAEVCQTTANAMLRGAPLHQVLCQACADICDACAVHCRALDQMDDCEEACQQCSASCLALLDEA